MSSTATTWVRKVRIAVSSRHDDLGAGAPVSPDRVRAAVTSANSSVVSWVASVSSSAKSRRWG